jgi:hypothetical protein
MGRKEPELDNKEKRAVKDWQGETAGKVINSLLNHVLCLFIVYLAYLQVPVLPDLLNAVLRIHTLLIRLRTLLFTLLRIRILLFNSILIRIRILAVKRDNVPETVIFIHL